MRIPGFLPVDEILFFRNVERPGLRQPRVQVVGRAGDEHVQLQAQQADWLALAYGVHRRKRDLARVDDPRDRAVPRGAAAAGVAPFATFPFRQTAIHPKVRRQ